MYLSGSTRLNVYKNLGTGTSIATAVGMKNIMLLLSFLMITACVRKVDVTAPQFIRAEGYSYVQGEDGRLYVVTANNKEFDEALKKIHPGPSSVDKLNLWVVTPLKGKQE